MSLVRTRPTTRTPAGWRYVETSLLLLTLLCGCAQENRHRGTTRDPFSALFPAAGTLLDRTGDEIVVCGQFFHIGTPVVLWLDPGGYDAYRVENHFDYEKPLTSQPASQPTSSPATAK